MRFVSDDDCFFTLDGDPRDFTGVDRRKLQLCIRDTSQQGGCTGLGRDPISILELLVARARAACCGGGGGAWCPV